MRLRKVTKAEIERAEKFNAAVEAFILSFGGRKIREKFGSPGLEKCGAEFTVQTVAGELHVTPEGDWIACCFQDVEAAKALLPYWPKNECAQLNGFCGKWNFVHSRGAKFDAEENLAAFKEELGPLLPMKRGCPKCGSVCGVSGCEVCEHGNLCAKCQ